MLVGTFIDTLVWGSYGCSRSYKSVRKLQKSIQDCIKVYKIIQTQTFIP